jgi:predicted metal-dependent hydrolase
MMLTSVVFITVQTAVHFRLMASRKILWKPWKWLRGLKRMWIWPADFPRLVPRYFTYYRPGFHPSHRDNTALVARWRDEMFGPDGTLREQLRTAA